MVFSNEDLGNEIAPEPIVNELSLPLPNGENTNLPTLLEASVHNRSRPAGQLTLIQPVEPVLGLIPEEQEIQEAPDLFLKQLLGLSYCQDQISTPLQTLDGIYLRQPSRLLPLAQEAQKIAKKIKEEEQASQWSGIPVEKLLNSSFNEQLILLSK